MNSSAHHQTVPMHLTVSQLVDRVNGLARGGGRVMIGISGAPGAGKSTLAEMVRAAAAAPAAVVPQDGFHIASIALDDERSRRRGAPDTYDIGGFLHLLRRLEHPREEVVYAPVFTRVIEDPIGSAIPIHRETKVVIVEGNYLLSDIAGWNEIHDILTESWYLDVAPAVRMPRLIARHIASGKTPTDAEMWSAGTDEANARLIDATRNRADLVFRLADMR